MSNQTVRVGGFTIIFGVMGTGKTNLQQRAFLPLNERNLIIPANKIDRAWHGYKKINWENILKKTTGLHQRDVYLLEREKYREKRNFFYEAMGEAFWKVRGNVLLPLNADEKVVFNAVIDQECGFKKGGLFVDDFTTYDMDGGNVPRKVKILISEIRHRELDIFFAAHHPDYAPPRLFKVQPHIILFKTGGTFENVRKKDVWSEETYRAVEAVRERVNRVAQLGAKHNDNRKYYCEHVQPVALNSDFDTDE